MHSLESAASIVLCAFNSNRKIELFQGKMLIESSVLRTILEIFFFFCRNNRPVFARNSKSADSGLQLNSSTKGQLNGVLCTPNLRLPEEAFVWPKGGKKTKKQAAV